jgi:hypothetical protein
MQPTESYLKVFYDVRPAKQVERRMLVESFQVLSHLGFPIHEYQYTGLGSIYFVDFIMFHKVLGIRRMLSVEHDEQIRKRVTFNQPFRCVRVKLANIANEIPSLSTRRKHILWLDYDSMLTREHLEHLWLSAAKLPRHSFILVTVDVEPPVKSGTPRKWRDYFRDQGQQYLGNLVLADFAQSNLVNVNKGILTRAIDSGVSSRNVKYIPLWAFSYADGHEMLTVGGMFGTDQDEESLRSGIFAQLDYVKFNRDSDPFRITVPRLTRKERLYLDKLMPAAKNWSPKQFELPQDWIDAYRLIYRYFPSYAELVL